MPGRGVPGRGAAARQMPHPALGVLALTHLLSRFRLAAIQRARVDVRRPHRRRQYHPTYDNHQTKAAHSKLGHSSIRSVYKKFVLQEIHRLQGSNPGFPISFAARSLPAAGMNRKIPHLRDTTRVTSFQAIAKFFLKKTLISI
jgi:hypothetical protein